MRWISFLLSSIVFTSVFSATSIAAEKSQQLEELLIWKISDELKLSSVEEKRFSDIVKDLNKKKSELTHALQENVVTMQKAVLPKQKEEGLSKHRRLLQNYSKLSEEEYDRLKPMLGNDRLIQYLVIKQDLTNRIKSMLVKPEGDLKTGKGLPQPKVIIEK